jgi:multiple sugar transport system substrate-binding protein/raffinose/stachyose/melibiose transport system substrate-binding protein
MKKAILIAGACVALAIAATVIFFQTNRISSSPKSPTVGQISLYHYFSGTLSGGLSEMIDTVNRRQNQYKVLAQALDHEAFKSMIHSTLAKSNPPELFSYWAGARVQKLVDQNKLESFDELWGQKSLSKRFSKSIAKAACTYNGKKYLLPITQFLAVFIYNKKIFDRQQLSPPESWDEFTDLCRQLKAGGINPIALGARERWPAQFWLDYLLLRTAGPDYRADLMKGRAAYTDNEVRRVYRIWSELLQKRYFNADANKLDWAEATALVAQGKAAMTLMGTWAIQVLDDEKYNLEAGKDYDFFPFPAVDRGVPRAAVGPIDGLVLSRGSASPVFAKMALTYFSEIEPQKKMSEGSGGLAPNLQVPRSFYSPFKQRIIAEIESTSHWAFNYDLATPPDVAEQGMDSFNELIEFPDQYLAILENLQTEARALFDEQAGR